MKKINELNTLPHGTKIVIKMPSNMKWATGYKVKKGDLLQLQKVKHNDNYSFWELCTQPNCIIRDSFIDNIEFTKGISWNNPKNWVVVQ